MLNSVLITFMLLIAIVVGIGCVSTHEPAEDYSKKISQRVPPLKVHSTVALILVDGLGAQVLSQNFSRIPHIQKYFMVSSVTFALAHSVFPSLTFPNLVSLLTKSPVNHHSVVGNQMLLRSPSQGTRRQLNYETHEDLQWLNQIKEPELVYSRLSQQNRVSASFAQSLNAGATARHPGDIRMASEYLDKNYFYIDQKNIRSMLTLLRSNPPEQWPEFIFLHLIGVDALAHDLGPNAPEVASYLEKLDQELKPLLALLESTEKRGYSLGTILTADHGFMTVKTFFDLSTLIKEISPETEVMNEGRLAALYFSESELANDAGRPLLMKKLAHLRDVQLTGLRRGNMVTIFTKTNEWHFQGVQDLTCPHFQLRINVNNQESCLDQIKKVELLGTALPPFAIENLLSYLMAPQAPDAVVLASDGVSFSEKYRGLHGGLTEREILVPLLLRGVKLERPRTPALFEILNVLKL